MAEIIVKLGDQVVQTYPLTTESITIGRARDNQIVVENLSVSRNHARIRREHGKFVLTDLNSANGSFLNGVKVSTADLKDNDIISIGKHKLHFIMDASDRVESAEEVSPVEAPEPLPSARASQHVSGDDLGAGAPEFGDWGFLQVTRGKQANVLFRLQAEETTVGRANENDIRLHDWFVSKRHAVIIRDAEGFFVRDLGSWRGITLNGAPIRESRIKHGDELVFGTTVVRFHVGPEDFRIEGTILSTELASEVQMPEAPEGFSSGEPDDYTGPVVAKQVDGGDDAEASAEDSSAQADEAYGTDSVDDDEYAPMTDEELAALEMEHDEEIAGLPSSKVEEHDRAEWEQLEAERMLAEGAGWHKNALDSDAEDDAAMPRPDPHHHSEEHDSVNGDDEDAEEEAALFGGPVSEVEPGSMQPSPANATPERPAAEPAVASGHSSKTPEAPEGVDPTEFRKWSRGLRNKSRIVRREAARKLKELTGIDYDWESEPE
jgi:pSer/pThr/pTyr-binding forkhead associated (FHA) protein